MIARVEQWLIAALLASQCVRLRAHFIKIDQQEFRASGYYPRPPLPPPIDQLPPQHVYTKELTPAELLVDLTNDLSFRVLHYHSILNRNNFAFSPSALMSVLVALYEGSAGRSAGELRNVLSLPNTNAIRIGYRDIHRRLRTYFFGSDNPLKGLSLNKDNVTITRDYEAILKFYGYDLGTDMISATPAPPLMTVGTATTMAPPATADAMTTAATAQAPESTTQQAAVLTTTEATTAAATTTAMTTATTMTPELLTTTEAALIITTETPTTEAPATTIITTTTTTELPTSTTEEATTEAATTTTTTEAATTTATPETTTTSTEAATEGDEGGGASETAELVSSFVAEDVASEPFLRIQKARVSRLPPSSKLQAPPAGAFAAPRANYLPSAVRRGRRRQARSRRHLIGGAGSYNRDLDASLFVTLFNAPPSAHALSHSIANDFEAELLDPHYHTAIAAAGPTGSGGGDGQVKANYNTDVISHVFYLGHQQIIHTTFKVYNAVLYFKYFEHLKISVLELELDTPEYNLMILLPDYHVDLVAAAASLRVGPTLRKMRQQLTPKWVQAIIPDFQLHGLMFLTNDLQNMGILDVFEPNRADFHPMTNEDRIYVKHIEQSINVNIRTRPINQLKRAYGTQTQPIQISVSHPFLFFVIDRELDVAVMAGRILNPQNVRIQ